MEILQEYKDIRDGNDCLLFNYLGLIKVNHELYVVLHVDAVRGGWTGNPNNAISEVFTDYEEALDRMNDIKNSI